MRINVQSEDFCCSLNPRSSAVLAALAGFARGGGGVMKWKDRSRRSNGEYMYLSSGSHTLEEYEKRRRRRVEQRIGNLDEFHPLYHGRSSFVERDGKSERSVGACFFRRSSLFRTQSETDVHFFPPAGPLRRSIVPRGDGSPAHSSSRVVTSLK